MTWYSKMLVVVLLLALASVFFIFGVRYQKHGGLMADAMKLKTINSQDLTYKKAPFGGEIPSNWSVFHGPDSAPAKDLQSLISANQLSESFAPDAVTFGDGAFNQVDFYVLSKNAAHVLLAEAGGSQVTKEIIGGVEATVIHYPTDHGQIDKAGSGGKDYIIGTGTSPLGYNQFILMRDWSQGGQEFETGFAHFLQTVNFTSGW